MFGIRLSKGHTTSCNSTKTNTGVAVLGFSPQELQSDLKVQGALLEDNIKAGEELAQASFTAEMCVMKV